MLVHRRYGSARECERLFSSLLGLGLHGSCGLLRLVYGQPQLWFGSDVFVALHYDARQQVNGVLVVGRGAFFSENLTRRCGDCYGLAQVFVAPDCQGKGIGRSLVQRLFEVMPHQRFAGSKSFQRTAAFRDRHRVESPDLSSLAHVLGGDPPFLNHLTDDSKYWVTQIEENVVRP